MGSSYSHLVVLRHVILGFRRWFLLQIINLVGGIPTPLKNMMNRQLGWFHSQLMESHKISYNSMFQSPPTSPMFFTTKEDDFMTWALQRRADPQEAIGPTSLGDRTRSATPLMHTEVRKSASLYMPWTLRTARHHFFLGHFDNGAIYKWKRMEDGKSWKTIWQCVLFLVVETSYIYIGKHEK